MATDGISMQRFLLSLVFAAAVTVGLALLMQQLIHAGDDSFDEPIPARPIEWVRLLNTKPVITKDPTVLKPPPVVRPPRTLIALVTDPNAEPLEWGSGGPVTITGPIGPTTSRADGDLLPIVAITPDYPERAKARGIEGYVTLKFTVNERGQVENAAVVDAAPAGIFDSAALRAISRFRYRPRVVNGEAQSVHGVQTRLRFELN